MEVDLKVLVQEVQYGAVKKRLLKWQHDMGFKTLTKITLSGHTSSFGMIFEVFSRQCPEVKVEVDCSVECEKDFRMYRDVVWSKSSVLHKSGSIQMIDVLPKD